MQILSAILFSLSANLDNLTIGIAYGVREVRISPRNNFMIAVISCAGTFLSMAVGSLVAGFFHERAANIIGSIILIAIGLWFLFDASRRLWRGEAEDPEAVPSAEDCATGDITAREVVAIAVALTLNNLGMGIGASISGLDPFLTSTCTFFISLFTISAGQLIGKTCLSKIFGKYTVLLSAILILGLGMWGLFA